MPMTNTSPAFETRPCGRCAGSGWHSYCQTWGHTCFQCGVKPHEQGLGRYLTKRGFVAHEFYIASLPKRRAADLQQGDMIREYGQWVRVRRVEPNTTCGRGQPDGTFLYDGVNVVVGSEDRGVTMCGIAEDHLYSVRPSDEERARLLAAALAYQETLTQAGKPRKQRRSRVAA
jgi:hypothetical protein